MAKQDHKTRTAQVKEKKASASNFSTDLSNTLIGIVVTIVFIGGLILIFRSLLQ